MKIKWVKINFEKMSKRYPQSGEFKNDLNIIWSNENNSGKTVFSRAIIFTFFSSSIIFPKSLHDTGELLGVEIEFELKGVEYIINSKKNNKNEQYLISKVGSYYFDDRENLFNFLFGDSFSNSFIKNIRPSWVGDRFLLDQDYSSRNTKLFPSFYGADYATLDKMDYAIINNYKDVKFEKESFDELSDTKNEIKKLDKLIANILEVTESGLTGNKDYDEETKKRILEEYKVSKKTVTNLSSIIFDLESKEKFLMMSQKNENRSIDKVGSVYIFGRNLESKNIEQFEVDMDSLLSFSDEPIEMAQEEIKKEIENIGAKINSFKSELQTEFQKFEILRGNIASFKNEVIDLNLNKLIQTRDDLIKKQNMLESNKKQAKLNFDIHSANIKWFKQDNDKKSEKYFEDFFGDDSQSGSDMFVRKFSDFITFSERIKMFNFPLIIDSIKEKDTSDTRIKIMLDKMKTVAIANEKQVFTTISSPDKKTIEGYDNFEIKKYNI